MFIEVDFLVKGYIGYEGMCDIYMLKCMMC